MDRYNVNIEILDYLFDWIFYLFFLFVVVFSVLFLKKVHNGDKRFRFIDDFSFSLHSSNDYLQILNLLLIRIL